MRDNYLGMRRRFEPDHPRLIIVAESPPANGLYCYDTTGRAGWYANLPRGQAPGREFARGHTTLLEALNRHRGKGQQKVTVEHVHVYSGGHAIVGSVGQRGGVATEMRGNSMQKPLPMHLSLRCGARTRSKSPCRSGAMPNGRCRMHGGRPPGAPTGKANGSYRHGQFTCEAIERRRELNTLFRAMQKMIEQIG
jgi:hypothetical protein